MLKDEFAVLLGYENEDEEEEPNVMNNESGSVATATAAEASNHAAQDT